MTPRIDWQWSGQHFFTSAAIRLHCWRNCLCDKPFDKKTWADPALGMWRRLESLSMVEEGTARIQYPRGSSTDSDGQVIRGDSSLETIEQGQQTPIVSSSTAWPTELLGPFPRSPFDNQLPSLAPEPASKNITLCGSHCQGTQDCATNQPRISCQCRVPDQQEKRQYGLDPIFPGTLCLETMLWG